MALVLFHTEKVKQTLKAPAAVGTEVFVLAAAAAFIGAILLLLQEAWSPVPSHTVIDLSFASLPRYTLMSLARGFAAYVLSLAFTLLYGSVAAHNHRAEKVMIPLLDVLQAIPVLGFLPGLVLALVHLFPTREIGLELACVIMIFTGQVWNMTFSYHASLRGIPQAMREVVTIQRFSRWQTFRWLELPASTIGLIWNSMMSMAGGWFFLTVNEAFRLGDNDYRLPGIGSYMSEAISRGNMPAMIAGVAAMVTMIVAVDQLFWRPVVVWSQRFKMEEQASTDTPQSWVLGLFRKSILVSSLRRLLAERRQARADVGEAARTLRLRQRTRPPSPILRAIQRALRAILLAGLLVFCIWGAHGLIRMLLTLPVRDTAGPTYPAGIHSDWQTVVLSLLASFARTTTAVALGAAWALPVGVFIGRSPKWSQRLQPFIQVLASFPAPMLFPLVTILLAWLHVPFNVGCIALMLLGTQWYILFNVVAGASAIPHDFDEAADVYHMSRLRRWKQVYLPSVFPFLVTGLITAAGGAWNATIVAEYLQYGGAEKVAYGLGSTISIATAHGQFPLLAASVITMAFFVVLVNRFFWKRLYRLAEARYSLNA
jgi:NitT/TauT family transport system permease protein